MRLVAQDREVVENLHIRPDLLLVKRRTAFIIDVSIVFENRKLAFEEARTRKMNKYRPLQQNLLGTYDKVEIIPFLIDSLGSWDPQNETFMTKLCSRKYAHLYRYLCVSDCIRWSRDIYIEHLTGTRQYQELQREPQPADRPQPLQLSRSMPTPAN